MPDNPFAQPAPPSSGVKWDDLKDRLVLVEPKNVETAISTAFGDSDAVRADIAVLDGPDKGNVYGDALIFPKVLQSQTRQQLGVKVLGRVGQGQGKPGQSPPWMLLPADEADQKIGMAYLEYRAANQLNAPAPVAASVDTGASVPF